MTEEKKEIHGDFAAIYQIATAHISFKRSLFAQLMFGLINEVSSGVVPTAATNGKKRYFDKKFMDGMKPEEQAFVVAHEICHEILMHNNRRGNRDHLLWNYVADIKINRMLLESGMTRPPTGVFDHKGETFAGKTEEFIYDYLEELKEEPPKDYVGDLLGDELSSEEAAQAQGRLQVAVDMHGIGKLGAEMQAALTNILNPPEKWYDYLRRYFTSKMYCGYDWTQLCRREFLRTGLIAPPPQSDSLGVVVISVDQSGSIDKEMLDFFTGHVNSIMQECRPHKIVVQYFDTEVHETEEYAPEDLPFSLRRICGGGTSFVDCCAKAEEHEATVHIILTDACGSFPVSVNIPTVWALTMDTPVPSELGETIQIEME